MLNSTKKLILGILDLHPLGLSNDEILWKLRGGLRRVTAIDLLDALRALSFSGEIERRRGKWVSLRSPAPPNPGDSGGVVLPVGDASSLSAAFARIVPTEGETPPDEDDAAEEDGTAVQFGWPNLMRYYEATQRQDPRGTVERFPDEHGTKWLLFTAAGHWWSDARLEIDVGSIPPDFRKALTLGKSAGVAAVGWPMSVRAADAGLAVLPALLLPVRWQLEDEKLAVAPDPLSPVLNPAWAKWARKKLGCTLSELNDALFPTLDEEDELGPLAARLGHLAAKLAGGASLRPADLAQEIALKPDSLSNVAALFLPDEASFTRGAARDLKALSDWNKARRSGTAAAALIDGGQAVPDYGNDAPALVLAQSASDSQFRASVAALKGPITAIQGPPGTGKSSTIVNLMASAIAGGKSVLFASKNHRALDEVEERLRKVFGELPVLTRGFSQDGSENTNFIDALKMLAESPLPDHDAALAADVARKALQETARRVRQAWEIRMEREELSLRLAELVDRLEGLKEAYSAQGIKPRGKLLQRLVAWLKLRLRQGEEDKVPEGLNIPEIEARISLLRTRRDALGEPDHAAVAEIDFKRANEELRAIARTKLVPDADDHERFKEHIEELNFAQTPPKSASLSPKIAREIVRYRPVWAITSLSVPSRVPLVPALFDYVIFDEASQCDIASALPLLARARKAIIVGDSEQLKFIPGLSIAQEHALMDSAELPRKGRASIAQSRLSLFDFVRRRVGEKNVYLLADQFRSAPEIVDYISNTFYGGRLVARRFNDSFSKVGTYKPGLSWEDVKGRTTREDGGPVNGAEAEWIVGRIERLVAQEAFDGSIGVVSPFNAQVARIQRLAGAGLPKDVLDRLTIGTVDRWQGGEADVIFFSLVVAPGVAPGAVTFLSRERRRINVAISRARAVAVVVGNLEWARTCRVSHIERLAKIATTPPERQKKGFDSLWERRVDHALRQRGLEPHPQYPVGRRYLDFALFQGEVKLDLEIDGRRWHTGAGGTRKTSDLLRDQEMIARGWRVRRFWVDELQKNMEGCLDMVERDLGRK